MKNGREFALRYESDNGQDEQELLVSLGISQSCFRNPEAFLADGIDVFFYNDSFGTMPGVLKLLRKNPGEFDQFSKKRSNKNWL